MRPLTLVCCHGANARGVLSLLALLGLAASSWLHALDQPSVPNAIPDVPRVLQFLESISGQKILSGQQEQVDWFGKNNEPEFDFILTQTGKLPAVRSFDFMFLSISNQEGRRGQRVAERAIEWRRSGGIVHICFHWNAGTPPNESFYVNQNGQRSDFDLERALTPGHRDHDEFIAEMDVVAQELKLLRDAGVAVIWRPFHEVNGNAGPNGGPGAWFWWGNKGPEVFKRAWKFMFERYTQVHGLNNLIWCYNPTAVAGALEAWYPGDEYVDMISLDIYPAAGTHPTFADVYQRFVQFKGGKKVFALSENGGIPDPDQLFTGTTAAGWTFFSTWDRDFIMGGTQNSLDFVKRVYAHENVITLDELVTLMPTPPSIVTQAGGGTARTGARVVMSVMAEGPGALGYQWYKDNQPLTGATAAEYVISAVGAAHAGTYRAEIKSTPGGTTWTAPAPLTIDPQPFVAPASKLVNLSTRGSVGVDADMMIAGFVIEGVGAKKLLIRAVGPGLARFGVSGVLGDAAIRLFDSNNHPLLYRDDWSSDIGAATLAVTMSNAGAFALEGGSLDAAVVVSLPPGRYSATVRSPVSGTGNALIEVYDLDPTSASRLINVATRGRVPNANDPMIVGFTVAGSGERPLVVRGVGPGLAEFGVPGVLLDPLMTLHTLQNNTQVEINRNDNWTAADAAAFNRVGAFGLPANSKDAALVLSLPAAGYSAIVRAPDNTGGVAIVEVYDDSNRP